MAQQDKLALTVIERRPVKIFKPRYKLTKRIFDLLICILVLPVVLPISLLVALVIYLDSEGPVLFIQERIGQSGKKFKIYKFRTLEHNLDNQSHREFMKNFVHGKIQKKGKNTIFKPFNKNQVTKIGNILRKTSLDELPQLINVIKGEMSLVGPRPHVYWEVEEYEDWHKERLEVLPGITGLAQVRGRSGILFDEIVYWDIEYIRHQSLVMDCRILLETFLSLRKGVR